MGLLDNWGAWSQDAGKNESINKGLLAMGLSLLNSKGSFGNALGQSGLLALDGYSADQQQQLKSKYMQAQIDETRAQAVQRERQAAQQAALQAFIQSRLNAPAVPVAQQALAEGARAGSIGPTVANAERMRALQEAPVQQGSFPFSFDDVVSLKAMGGPDILEHWKAANDPMKLEGGSIYKDRLTGAERFIPKVDNGVQLSNGQASVLPGYADANATIKGAEAAAVEGAKAGYSFVEAYDPVSKQPIKVRTDVAAGRPNVIPPDQQKAANAESLRVLQEELGRARPEDRPAVLREIERLRTTGSPTGVVPGNAASVPGSIPSGPSARDDALANYDKEVQFDLAGRRKSIYDAGESATSRIGDYRRLGQLLKSHDGGSLSPKGLEISKTLNSMGLQIDPATGNKEAATALANKIALDLRSPSGGAGMPGAMSDSDRQFLASMVPGLSTTAQGRAQMISYAIAVEQRKVQVAEFARRYENVHGRLDNGFFSQLSAWSKDNPLFARGGK